MLVDCSHTGVDDTKLVENGNFTPGSIAGAFKMALERHKREVESL